MDPVASAIKSYADIARVVVPDEQPTDVVGREREDRNPGLSKGRDQRGQDPGQMERQPPTH